MALKQLAPSGAKRTIGQTAAPSRSAETVHTAKLIKGRVYFAGHFEFKYGVTVVLDDIIKSEPKFADKFKTAEAAAEQLDSLTYTTNDGEEDLERNFFLVKRGVERPKSGEDANSAPPRRLIKRTD